jgi:hypothetical protein
MVVHFGSHAAAIVQSAIARAAARRTAWDAGEKVWLADVAAELRLPLTDLAGELIRMAQAGAVKLSRCDLPFLAPAGLVDASELHSLDGCCEYHFARVATN